MEALVSKQWYPPVAVELITNNQNPLSKTNDIKFNIRNNIVLKT